MSIVTLLSRLKELEISIQLENNDLKVEAPKGRLTKALVDELRANKEELLEFLQTHTGEQLDYTSIEPVEAKEYYPLSPAQKRLYIIQQMESNNISYNMPGILPLEEAIDTEKLAGIFNALISRHESLRTCFITIDGEPYQRIDDEVKLVIDQRSLVIGEEEPIETILQDFLRPFDLSQAPLLRVGLVELQHIPTAHRGHPSLHTPTALRGHPSQEGKESRYLLLLDMHHIITDGTSLTILKEEFRRLYIRKPLPGFAIRYRDYSQWLNRPEQKERIKKQGTYWHQVFLEERPVLNLPLDFPRPGFQDFEGNTVSFVLEPGEANHLKEISGETGATLYMTLLSIVNILLSKLSALEDIIVGTPVAARRHPKLQQVIGMFVNTLVMRNRPLGDKTFISFLTDVKKQSLDAYENQEYPFEDLVDRVSTHRDTSRNPLFDVMFNLLNQADYPQDIRLDRKGNRGHLEYTKRTSKFDLNFTAIELGNQIFFELEYCSKLFKESAILRFINYFKQIIQCVSTDRHIKLAGIEIIPAEEKEQLLRKFNDTGVDFPDDKTIQQLFREQAEQNPGNIAAVGPMQLKDRAYMTYMTYISYRELNQRSNQLANLLREKGVKADTVVGLMMERSLEMVVGILGILKAGGAYLPIDAQYPGARKTYMLKDSGIRVLLASPGIKVEMQEKSMEIIDISTLSSPSTSNLTLTFQVSPANLVYIIYTSGSTGKPKGVLLEHRNLVNLLIWNFRHTNMDFSSVLQFATICFDASFHEIFSTLLSGGRLCLIHEQTRTDIPVLFEIIEKHKIKTLFLPMSMLKVIFSDKDYIEQFPGCVRHIQTAGEQVVINDGLRDFLRENNVFLHNHYGPSETHVVTAFTLSPTGDIPALPPIGKPVSNTTIYILDRYDNIQPLGVPGELYIGGIQVGRGYLNKPGLTCEKFVIYKYNYFNRSHRSHRSYIYRTGDLARWLEDGNIQFLGRIDSQVKIRGFRVELEEIENQLIKHEKIKETLVIQKEIEPGDKYLCAYVVTIDNREINQLREYLSAALPFYMIPAYFVFLEKIPLSPSGKVDRKALPEPQIKIGAQYTAPRTKIEKKLTEVWSEVLAVEKDRFGIDANFFQLGGHSLKATVMAAKVHKTFNIKVPLAEVFKRQTIRRLAQYIKAAKEEKYTGIKAVEKKEHYDMSSAQKRIYFLQRMDIDSTAYNMPIVLSLVGNLEKNKLEATLKRLIRRHESLRTSFILAVNEPVQKVQDTVNFEIEYPDAKIDRVEVTVKEFIRPFDLSKAPLIRSGLIHLPDNHYTWMLDIHHIISDGTSNVVLTEDFISLYNHETLKPLRLQYKDFSQWQNDLFEKGEIKEQEDYWLSLYAEAGEIPRLNLPQDFRRPEVFTFSGESYTFKLEREEALTFNELAAREGATLYMNMLAVLNTLFYKYAGQPDIIIGSGIAGRRHEDLQQIVGMFVNTLAVRNYPRGDKTYEFFLKEVAANTIKAFENQDVQFEELVDKLGLERNPSRNPLFDISMVVQNFRKIGEDVHKGKSHLQADEVFFLDKDKNLPVLEYRNLTSKFDMTFFVMEREEEIFIGIEYYTGVFREKTIKRLVSHIKNIIKTVAAQPSIKIKDVDILSPGEKKQVLYESNQTDRNYPKQKTIHELFEDQAASAGDRIALLGGINPMFLTYDELNKKSNRLANYLSGEKNIHPGDMVGILMDNSFDLIIAVLGILKAGAAYIPIDPLLPEERTGFIIRDTVIGTVISSKKYIKMLNRLQWENQSQCFHTYLCTDSQDIYKEDEAEPNELMDEELWHHVGETAEDEIAGGGWVSSYTGEKFSRREMDEYGNNILEKLEPLLHKNMRVLEIGTASGISMFRIAPRVGLYYGTDLSGVIIEKNKKRAAREGHQNIKLACLAAHEIQQIEEKDFDLIIINSVIHCFHGHHYLRKVIAKLIDLLGREGYIFIGDIMDQDLKENLTREMKEYKRTHMMNNSKTKTDWSTELFVSRRFFADLSADFPFIDSMEFSRKIYTIENELTKFRYDALLTINKGTKPIKTKSQKHKYQEDIRVLDRYPDSKSITASRPGDTAYVIYTSGTTGKPKGVMIRHQSLVNYIHWAARQYVDKEVGQLAFPLYTNVSFDLTVTSIYLPLISGNRIVIYEQEMNRLPILDVVNENKVEIIKATPSHLKILHEEITAKNTRLKRFIIGGEELETQLAREVTGRFHRKIEIFNEYGPTEATVGCMIYKFDEIKDKRTGVPIGLPIDNTRIYILDRHLTPVPPGAIGEIYISGDALAQGYLNDPGLTAEKFIFGSFRFYKSYRSYKSYIIYKSGDTARFLPDGNIEFSGRTDKQVKIRGYRIELKEIENHVLEHVGIKEAIVLSRQGTSDAPGKENIGDIYICCYWVPVQKENPPGTAEIKEYLYGKLPAYMIPSYFVKLEKIPLTSNGKVDRKALPPPEMISAAEYMAPRDEVEKKLVKIWSGVLKRNVGINDNFFDLGGDSIKAIQVSARLKEYDINLKIADLFLHPVINQLSAIVKKMTGEINQEPVEGKVPLTPIQQWFFNHDFTHRHHYNHAVMLFAEKGLDESMLTAVFTRLVQHHDALRMIFEFKHQNHGKILQKCRAPQGKLFDLEVFHFEETHASPADVGGIPLKRGIKDIQKEIEAEANRIQASIDLENGPLVKLGLFKTPVGDHLLIVIHHLVIDGISWRILFEDISSAYRQLQQGEKITFPGKTHSFKYWSQKLTEYALVIGNKNRELNYWQSLQLEGAKIEPLPRDHEIPMEKKKNKYIESLAFHLDEEETRNLLEKVNRLYNTGINDILLTALGMAVQHWTGIEKVLISLEGHGREPVEEDMDISRTVGWFTAQYPVILDMSQSRDLAYTIKSVKETLRRIPVKGIGWDIFRYLTPAEKKRELTFSLEPEISFNYLGQFDPWGSEPNPANQGDFQFSPLGTGKITSPEMEQIHTLTVNGMTAAGRLIFTFSYNTYEYNKTTIRALVDNCKSLLLSIIHHCTCAPYTREKELTPSDVMEVKYLDISLEKFAQITHHIKSNIPGNPAIKSIYPLSPMQKGMLYHAITGENTDAYFIQTIFQLEGEIKISLLEASFNKLIERYDIFRTLFIYERLDEPIQLVLDHCRVKVYFEDITGLKEDEQALYLETYRKKDKARGFDLSEEIPMRLSLFKEGVNCCRLLWSYHHILMDGWCMGVIFKELFQFYDGLRESRALELAVVPPYKNYIAWLEKQDKSMGLHYWQKYLEGYEQPAVLPSLPPIKHGDYQGEKNLLQISSRETHGLNRLAGINGVTINIVFQALWGILLQKYNNCDDVVFGTVVSGRPPEIKGIETMVGLFINTVPVRIKTREDQPFSQLLKNLQESSTGSKSYEYLQLADIQALSHLKDKLITHLMIFQNYPEENIQIASRHSHDRQREFRVKDMKQFDQTNYDLNVIILPGSPHNQLAVKFIYNTLAYEQDVVKRMGRHLKEILRQVKDEPGLTVKSIEIITAEERKQVLFDFNQTSAAYPADSSIHRLFENQEEQTPDYVALIGKEAGWKDRRGEGKKEAVSVGRILNAFGEMHLSYRQLKERSDQLAHLLSAKGVRPDNIVGIMAERSVEMIIGLLAILKAGGAYLPIDPEYPEQRIKYMLKDSNAGVLLTTAKLQVKVKAEVEDNFIQPRQFPIQFINIEMELASASEPLTSTLASTSTCQVSPANLAYVIYTSGSTGSPKGAAVRHQAIVNTIYWRKNYYRFNYSDTILQIPSFSFDSSVTDIFTPLHSGSKLVLMESRHRLNLQYLSQCIVLHAVTHFIIVPNFYRTLLQEIPDSLKHMRTVTAAGEQCASQMVTEHFQRLSHVRLFNEYGPTENSVCTTVYEFLPGAARILVGKPIANTRCLVLDASRKLTPLGVPGELYITGAGLAEGYLNNPQLTAEKFDHDFQKKETSKKVPGQKDYRSYKSYKSYALYKTGDLGRWLSTGEIEFLGRIDQQVKIRGFRIELEEIENRLLAHPAVKSAAAAVKQTQTGENYLCAYIVSEKEIDIPGIRAHLSKVLPDYMLPSYFLPLEKIPLTTNGKVDRKTLPTPEIIPREKFAAPRSENEKKLVEIWADVLGLETSKIGINKDFFQLGGHSLRAINFISQIHKTFNVKISLAVFFENPTIRQLSQLIEKAKENPFVSLVPAEKKEYYPLSPAQQSIYTQQQKNKNNLGYNWSQAFVLKGDFDKKRMKYVIQQLIKRHESFRTSFEMVEDEPVQRIYDQVEFEIGYYEVPEEKTGDIVTRFIKPFDLTKAPLLRSGIIKIEKNKHICMFDMHHTIYDGISSSILNREFLALFNGETFPSLKLQYKDFTQWQNSEEVKKAIIQQETFWKTVFAGKLPGLNLPTDFPRPRLQEFKGDSLFLWSSREDTRGLKTIETAENATSFMVLLTLYYILFFKLTGQEDIIIGTPVAGRRHTDLQHVVGMFVNTLAIRNFPKNEITFKKFLEEVRKNTLEAFENQEYPFEKLMEIIPVKRDISRHPLFDVMFVMHHDDEIFNTKIRDLQIEPFERKKELSHFDLLIGAIEQDNRRGIVIEYSTSLFKRETIEKILKYYTEILKQVIENRDIKLKDIRISYEYIPAESPFSPGEEEEWDIEGLIS